MLEGALIIVAALLIMRAAYDAFLRPARRRRSPRAASPSTRWRRSQRRLGVAPDPRAAGAWRSPALVADGWHLVTDVVTSVGVLVGLVLATLDRLGHPRPAARCRGRRSISSGPATRSSANRWAACMDEAVARRDRGAHPAGDQRKRRRRDRGPRHPHPPRRARDVHRVPSRRARRHDGAEAHAICDRIEAAIGRAVEGVALVIHVEPEDKSKRHRPEGDAVVL